MTTRHDRIEAAELELMVARRRAAIAGDDHAIVASAAMAFAGAYLGLLSSGLSRRAHAVALLAARHTLQWGDRHSATAAARRRGGRR